MDGSRGNEVTSREGEDRVVVECIETEENVVEKIEKDSKEVDFERKKSLGIGKSRSSGSLIEQTTTRKSALTRSSNIDTTGKRVSFSEGVTKRVSFSDTQDILSFYLDAVETNLATLEENEVYNPEDGVDIEDGLNLDDTNLQDPLIRPSFSRLSLNSPRASVGSRSMSMALARNLVLRTPWSPTIYFTTRGAENIHVYLWLAKDLSWTQDWMISGMLFGALAIAWSVVLFYIALRDRSYEDAYMLVPYVGWLCANYYWMEGELINGDDDIVAPRTSYIMVAMLVWALAYYVIWRPLGFFQTRGMDEELDECSVVRESICLTKDDVKEGRSSMVASMVGMTAAALPITDDDLPIKPRFPCFRTWREYENFHVVCWLAKDLAWARSTPWAWFLCLFPAFFVSTDFVLVTLPHKEFFIDSMHYVSQWLWVIGNSLWALGQVGGIPGEADDDAALSWYSVSGDRLIQCRWWSSIFLLLGWLPIIILYAVWIPLTLSGKLETPLPAITLERSDSESNFDDSDEVFSHDSIDSRMNDLM